METPAPAEPTGADKEGTPDKLCKASSRQEDQGHTEIVGLGSPSGRWWQLCVEENYSYPIFIFLIFDIFMHMGV